MFAVSADNSTCVNRTLHKNKRAPACGKADEEYLLTTKLFCGKCGALMFGESGTSATGRTYYINAPTSSGARAATKRPCRRTGWKIWSSGKP